jgi:hypothetical protein
MDESYAATISEPPNNRFSSSAPVPTRRDQERYLSWLFEPPVNAGTTRSTERFEK